jgi:hypothetical protein
MTNKKGFWSMLAAALALGFIVLGCSTPPPIRPALSQTVINIQRSSTSLDTGDLYIYVDDLIINPKAPIKKGQFVTYPVNNGVHYIHGVCGKLVSEAINFSANNKTVSLVATIEKEPGLFGKKKLVITRSTVSDDTGSQTDQDIQESYGDIQ